MYNLYVDSDGVDIAFVYLGSKSPVVRTKFFTTPTHSLQAGVIVQAAGTTIQPHLHVPTRKEVVGCQEILIVQTGLVDVTIYCPKQICLGIVTLHPGDMLIQYLGGHSFYFLKDTTMIEVKQGPFIVADKVTFNPFEHEQTK